MRRRSRIVTCKSLTPSLALPSHLLDSFFTTDHCDNALPNLSDSFDRCDRCIPLTRRLSFFATRHASLEKQLHKEEKAEDKQVTHALKATQRQAKEEKKATKVRSLPPLSRLA